MLSGIKFPAKSKKEQARVRCAWLGGAKFVWNAKCDEDIYLRRFAYKYLPIKTFPNIDQKYRYSEYKNDDLSVKFR